MYTTTLQGVLKYRGRLLWLLLWFGILCGCAPERAQLRPKGREPREDLVVVYVLVDLPRLSCGMGPGTVPVRELASVSATGGVYGGVDNTGDRWKGPDFTLSMDASGRAIHVSVRLERGGRTVSAESSLPVEKGVSCIHFLPTRDNPEFVFVAGISGSVSSVRQSEGGDAD